MATGLIEALTTAAREAREEKGISHEQVAAALGKGVDVVRRFERMETYGGLDALLEAYETVGISLFDLLDDAKATLKKNGSPS